MHQPTIAEEPTEAPVNQQERPIRKAGHRQKSPPPASTVQSNQNAEGVPHALRSSFVLGVCF